VKKEKLVAVTSRSFSANPILRAELLSCFPNAKFLAGSEKLQGNSLVEFLSGFSKVIAGLEYYSADIFSALPDLKVISRFGVGVDNLDLSEMNRRGIRLSIASGANSLSVAELVVNSMLALIRKNFYASLLLKSGKWKKVSGSQLTGKTIGIVGAGKIGREVIRLLSVFKCKILIYDIKDNIANIFSDVIRVSFDELLRKSDIITLHVPYTNHTKNMFNESIFAKMRSSAFLINTARGGLVDQSALKDALMNKVIAGAAIDVYQDEPPDDKEFLQLPNLLCTPHIAGNSIESDLAMGMAAIEGLETAKLPDELFNNFTMVG